MEASCVAQAAHATKEEQAGSPLRSALHTCCHLACACPPLPARTQASKQAPASKQASACMCPCACAGSLAFGCCLPLPTSTHKYRVPSERMPPGAVLQPAHMCACVRAHAQAIWYFAAARFLYEGRKAWQTTNPPDMAPGMFAPVVFVAWMNTTGLSLLLGATGGCHCPACIACGPPSTPPCSLGHMALHESWCQLAWCRICPRAHLCRTLTIWS